MTGKQFASAVYDGINLKSKKHRINADAYNTALAISRGMTEDDLGAMVDQPPVFKFDSEYESALGYDPDEHDLGPSTKGDCE